MGKSKPFFNDVDLKTDFPVMEREILSWWYKNSIVDKYLQKNVSSKKHFSFLDGPITANNPMGVHHAWGRTYKDLWQRYKNMKGYKQRFQNGFDCQGLWVEVEVEKELGLRSKKDIENLVKQDVKKSISNFVELCKKRVYKYADVQTDQSKRLGHFMDWDNSYFTLSDENNYMIWHFLEKCHQKGLIYKGRDSVPWCPRCGTAISQHEILTEDYKQLVHDSIYVSYPIESKKDENLLIWTTTPWTLPANVSCAVDAKKDYVLAESKDKRKYYLLESVAKKLGFSVIKKVKGKDLVGLKYSSPFDHLSRVERSLGKSGHKVISTDERILEITDEEGTGIVHIATGAGTEDFALGKLHALPVVEVIDEEASYIDGLGQFTGKNAKRNPNLIINYLKEKGFLVKTEKYKHRYPVCWRCKKELVWRVVDEWYIAIDPVRENMKKIAKRINWIPKFGLKRELDWLNNMHDWLISKKRYWGLALPIWECKKCNSFQVIGSKEELRQKAVSGWSSFKDKSPHRPWVDEVKIKCDKCKSIAQRIPDVGSPWLDAGIVSFSTIAKENKGEPLYTKDKKAWRKWFPAEFITESFPGQFKNWFYSLIAMSTVLENEEPFKNVLGFATLFGEDGKAMHKSLGNAIEFNEGADRIGVDVMRWMYARQNPSDNLLFGYRKADEARRRFHIRLWNIYNFFVSYANLDNWKPPKRITIDEKNLRALDKWILLRLVQTEKIVTESLDKYDAFIASNAIDEFVDDFSTWYIRRSRDRVGPQIEDNDSKNSFYKTCYFVLVNLVKILAPFTPFISEEIFKNLTKEKSVHLTDWPSMKKLKGDNVLKDMQVIREVVEAAHAERKEKGIPVRQPLSLLNVKHSKQKPKRDYLELLENEVNVEEVKWIKGKQLGVKFDTKITPLLKKKAKVRNLIREIQKERKKMQVSLNQKVDVVVPWLPEEKSLLEIIKTKTLAKSLTRGKFKVKVN